MDELDELAGLGSTSMDLTNSLQKPDKENEELTEEEMQKALSNLSLNKKGNRLTRSPIKPKSPKTTPSSMQTLTSRNSNLATDSVDSDEEGAVPLQLLTEFLQCVMSKDWRNALKLCNYILMYDKEHEMANQYSPMLRRAVMELEEGSTDRKSDIESETEEDDSEESENSDDSDDSNGSDDSDSDSESEKQTSNNNVYGVSLDLARQRVSENQSSSKSSPKRSGWVP